MATFHIEDYELRADQLDAKYNPDGDGQHPGYTREQWRCAVAQEDTLRGYWGWVEHQLEMERDELDRDNPYNQPQEY